MLSRTSLSSWSGFLCQIISRVLLPLKLGRYQGAIFVVAVKAAHSLASEVTGVDVLLEQRAGPVLIVAQDLMHDLHDREAGIKADEIRQLERPHRLIGAQLHRSINVGDTADSLIERIDRFIDHREQNAIYDKARKIFRGHRAFAELSGKPLSGFVGFL